MIVHKEKKTKKGNEIVTQFIRLHFLVHINSIYIIMYMYIYNHIKQSIIGEYEMVNIRDILEILKRRWEINYLI